MKEHNNTTPEKENKNKWLAGKAFLAAAVPVVLHFLWHLVLHFGLVAITAATFKNSIAVGIVVGIIIAVIVTIICAVRHKRHTKCTECGLTAEEHHKC
jgi:uncharacterized membrane protein YagU involved in acid resistance